MAQIPQEDTNMNESEHTEQEESDPLAGAGVGETATIRESVDLPTVNFSPEVYFGSDRFGDYEVADLEVVEDEYGEQVVRVVFEGDVTKRLPRRWDYHREPVTVEEKRAHRRKTWGKRLASVGVTAGVMGGTLALAAWIAANMVEGLSDVTLNGEAMAPASGTDIWLSLVPILAIAALIMYGLQGGFPGRVRRGHR